jgi:glycosyltransferase involved in cell wall biosynthesis
VSDSGGGGSPRMRAIRSPDLVLKTLQYAAQHGVRETAEVILQLRARLGEAALKAARTRYSWDAHVRRILDAAVSASRSPAG